MSEYSMESLEAERRGLLDRIGELDRLETPVRLEEELQEMREILKKQRAYAQSLGFFKGAEKKRMAAQLQEREQAIADKEAELENLQHEIEDKITELNLAVNAIETEMARRTTE